jgi:Homing endonuclease associated repeat
MRIDSGDLAAFQAGLRRRYSDEQILSELKESAARLGRSPTMREFERDRRSHVHPQTVVGRFGSWNAAKRQAGLRARRFATREELLEDLRALGRELGRPPTAKDLQRHRAAVASKSLYWHTFGSLTKAVREAGFDVPVGEERLERAVEQGAALARRLRRLPRFADWATAHERDSRLPSEWQVYRLAGGGKGAWASFQYLVRNNLAADGVEVEPDGRLRASGRRRPSRGRQGVRGRSAAPRARARQEGAAR